MNVIYRKSDGAIQHFTDGNAEVKPDFSLAQIIGEYTGNETNISELEIENIVKEITKLAIIDRLIAIDRIDDALTALESDTIAKARWEAAISIKINDPDVIALLTAIGVDPETILY